MVLLAAGLEPFWYRNCAERRHERNTGLAVYLDVSGSVGEHMPRILGLLGSLKRELLTIFQFSNGVVETPFSELLEGKLKTTFGTDFTCVAQSIIEGGFERAVVFTDGFADMDEAEAAELKTRRVELLTVLFGEGEECPALAEFGEVVRLEEVCI